MLLLHSADSVEYRDGECANAIGGAVSEYPGEQSVFVELHQRHPATMAAWTARV